MNFYEYHVHPEIDLEGVVKTLEKLRWSGACFVCNSIEKIKELKNEMKNLETNLDIAFGYKIETDKPNNVTKLARRFRRRVEIILVHGGKLEINRKACETPEVDILTHPELGRNDGGLDYVMAKLAKENHVAIEFNFRNLLLSYGKIRSAVFSSMLNNARLVKKYKAPFVLTSGAVEPYDLRSPSELIAFGRTLGLNSKDVKLSLSDGIIKENRKRLGGRWIMPGVEIE